jgi:hypothetical protein
MLIYYPHLPIPETRQWFESRISLPFTVARAVAALHRSSHTSGASVIETNEDDSYAEIGGTKRGVDSNLK